MQNVIWEKEYKKPKLITKYDKPQAFFLKFIKLFKKGEIYRDEVFVRKNLRKVKSCGNLEKIKVSLKGLKVLDLGSGTGRNANYLAQNGAKVVGMEFSNTAFTLAKKRSKHLELSVEYFKQSIGSKYPFKDKSFDLIIDITSSNSLNEKERRIYLEEVNRVLKKDGVFFVRALCKDGDKNAKYLLKNNSGEEKDTYVMPSTNLIERVFSEEDFIEIYSRYFKILKLEKTESYSTVENRIYKRKFWLAIMENK